MHNALTSPVYMLAIDHRWQWVEWCEAHRIEPFRIREVKTLATDAFLLARRRSPHARDSGVLLIDLIYGTEGFARACAAGVAVGTPAERAGVFPLEWTGTFEAALRGRFAKVLVRHRADVPQDIYERQLTMLGDLHKWCTAVEKPLIVEVLVSGPTEDEAFEREGRPRLLADYIRSVYRVGVVPQYWKMEGVPDSTAMRIIDEAICERDGTRQLILGKGAALETVERWFASARGAASAAGFAIGRTVYWDAACQFLLGRTAADEAVHQIAANYETVIELWRRAHAG
jgi:5-dehydro-2-deoxygluconokinase